MFGVLPLIATMVTPARMAAAFLPAPTNVSAVPKNVPAMRAIVFAETTIPINVWNGVR